MPMSTHSPVKQALKAAMTLVASAIFANGADAASIIQTADFVALPMEPPEFGSYAQFDPALGTLTQVDFGVTGTLGDGSATFFNMSDQTVTFDGSVSFGLATDAGTALALN
jgi:hypothetical protein